MLFAAVAIDPAVKVAACLWLQIVLIVGKGEQFFTSSEGHVAIGRCGGSLLVSAVAWAGFVLCMLGTA